MIAAALIACRTVLPLSASRWNPLPDLSPLWSEE
jgi:hypothetical protein